MEVIGVVCSVRGGGWGGRGGGGEGEGGGGEEKRGEGEETGRGVGAGREVGVASVLVVEATTAVASPSPFFLQTTRVGVEAHRVRVAASQTPFLAEKAVFDPKSTIFSDSSHSQANPRPQAEPTAHIMATKPVLWNGTDAQGNPLRRNSPEARTASTVSAREPDHRQQPAAAFGRAGRYRGNHQPPRDD